MQGASLSGYGGVTPPVSHINARLLEGTRRSPTMCLRGHGSHAALCSRGDAGQAGTVAMTVAVVTAAAGGSGDPPGLDPRAVRAHRQSTRPAPSPATALDVWG